MSAGERIILRGWKEIEAYLRMGRRAIIAAGYPVRHEYHGGRRCRSVFAFRDELLAHARRGASIVNGKGENGHGQI